MSDERRPTDGIVPEYRSPQVEALLRQAIELVEQARPMPLSASSIINKEDVLAALQSAVEKLPEELRAARWLLKERDSFLARVQREGDQIVATSRTQAEQMVQRTEIAKVSQNRARQIIAEAEEKALQVKLETEDWCDQKLGAMEIVLERTMKTVRSGRARLQGAERRQEATAIPVAEPEVLEGFFDQDDG